MPKILAASFLNTPWGMALFIAADIVVFVLIAALNYRWLFKRLFDILFSAAFLLLFLPFFLIALAADAVYNRAVNASPALVEHGYYCGKKGKIVRVSVLTSERILHAEDGSLLPEKERVTGFGKFLKGSSLKYYPLLWSVFLGRMSFVGPVLMTVSDGAALSPEGRARFAVRPGIVSSLARYGGPKLTYAEMLEEDALYAAHVGLFRDIAFFMTRLAQKVRGERVDALGEAARRTYLESLLASGAITEEEAAAYREDAEARIRGRAGAASEKKRFQERELFRRQ